MKMGMYSGSACAAEMPTDKLKPSLRQVPIGYYFAPPTQSFLAGPERLRSTLGTIADDPEAMSILLERETFGFTDPIK